MVFPVVRYGCESWTIKKAEHWRTDAFELWCWRRLLRVPWTARRSKQSILKEISPEYPLEGLMLKLKLQYFGHLIAKSWLIGKDPDTGKDWRREVKGATEDETVGWPHRLNEHEFEQTPGDSEGEGSLVCCSPWGCKESDTTERPNNSLRYLVWAQRTRTFSVSCLRFFLKHLKSYFVLWTGNLFTWYKTPKLQGLTVKVERI